MRKNHSYDYLYHYNVNLAHVISHGLFADGKNGVVRISRYDKE